MKEKFIANGIEYVSCGDYYIPNLEIPEQKHTIGKYGLLHGKFIKENHRSFYSLKMSNGTWYDYLSEIDIAAKEMIDNLIKDMATKQQGVTEELKAKDPMKWVGMMNNIKHSAEEIVFSDLIYRFRSKSNNH